jgi:hypothetical protein
MTTQNIRNKQLQMSPVEFEAAIPAQERLQNYAFDRAATGVGENEVPAGKTSTALSTTNPKDCLGSKSNA